MCRGVPSSGKSDYKEVGNLENGGIPAGRVKREGEPDGEVPKTQGGRKAASISGGIEVWRLGVSA